MTRDTNCAQLLKLRNSWTAIGCFGLAGFVQDGCCILEQLSIRFDGIFTEDKLNLFTATLSFPKILMNCARVSLGITQFQIQQMILI